MTKLHRSEDDRMIAGVCGGLAETYDMDSTIVRLITAALVLWGVTPVIYLLAWVVIPSESEVYEAEEVDIDQTD